MTAEGTQRRTVFDPLAELMRHYAGREDEKREKPTPAGTVEERLRRRIVDGDRSGLQADLDEALRSRPPLDIINSVLLEGMKTVGELFGSGQMQLPFVLQSAEAMKAAVAYLEPHMDRAQTAAKGTMVIATVKGDVHDIGKNLVDIILTNNGYRVVNLGIKVSLESMLHAVAEHGADALGMSGLLVKSTLVMKENLEVMNERGITLPVVLGGAALTRRYVEQELCAIYGGKVVYANDAFDGLRFMASVMGGSPADGAEPAPQETVEAALTGAEAKIALAEAELAIPAASPAAGSRAVRPVSRDVPIPEPPFWGVRVVEDVPLEEVFRYVNETALIRGQWQVRKGSMSGQEYDRFLRERVYPDYGALKERIMRGRLLEPRVAYGYFPCRSEGNDLVICMEDHRNERTRFTFPRQKGGRNLCLADFFAPAGGGRTDVVAFQLVTMGRGASEEAARLYAAGDYRDYLYFHGLSVEAAEALAELWHKRIREELGIAGGDATDIRRLFSQGYQGSRYSFGYPACPNLEDQEKLCALLEAGRIGVRLTEGFSLDPEQSTNALIAHHPEARYFNIR
ncbi:MAG: vitamin B12 dependent-methionine synthase activation domain-containing protein [Bacteroidota bacterium]